MKIMIELDEVYVPTAQHRRRRMVVVRRDDGHFSYAEQYYYISEWGGEVVAEGWASLPAEGLFATVGDAETEARLALEQRLR